MYHEIVLNSLAYLGMKSIEEIEQMTLNEYFLRCEAYQLKIIKRNEELALQAWYIQNVQATKGSAKHPKPMFTKFEQFFDTQSIIDDIRAIFETDYHTNAQKDEQKINEQLFIQRMKEFKELKKNGLIKPWSERSEEERGGF